MVNEQDGMVDAYKCQNCGDVVESLGSCPSCGENEMQPTRVPESELETEDDEAPASSADESTEPDTPDTGTTADSQQAETEAGTTAESQRRDRTRSDGRTGSDNGGLLAWLKSLF